MTDTCTICKLEPCECEITEADYEYGQPGPRKAWLIQDPELFRGGYRPRQLRAQEEVEARLRDTEPTPWPERRQIEESMVMMQNEALSQQVARLHYAKVAGEKRFFALSVVFVAAFIWAAVVTAILVTQ